MEIDETHGYAIWLTGMSGAGKTTLASRLKKEFEKRGLPVEMLDGDIVRRFLGKDLGYSREDRIANLERVTFLARLLQKHGVNVICSFIAPYEVCRSNARRNLSNYIEIYVKCPLDVLIRRDPDGLYKKALAGEIDNFTGISDPFEEPESHHVCVETDCESEDESFLKIASWLEKNHVFPPEDKNSMSNQHSHAL